MLEVYENNGGGVFLVILDEEQNPLQYSIIGNMSKNLDI